MRNSRRLLFALPLFLIGSAHAAEPPVTCESGSCTTARITPQVKAILEKEPDHEKLTVRLFSEAGLTNADLKTLERIPWLRQLELVCEGDGCDKVTDFSALAKLPDLEDLDATGADHLTSLAPLAGAKKLSGLRLRKVPLVDITALKGKPLVSLKLDSTQLKTLDALAGNVALRRLTVSVGETTDVSALAGLTGLHELTLDGGALASSQLFAKMQALTDLTIVNKKLTEIAGLASLTKLTDLELVDTPVAKLAPLAGLAQLKRLRLRRLPATQLPPLSTKALEKVNFTGTLFSDLAPLAASPALWDIILAKETAPAAVAALRKKLPKATVSFDRGKGIDP